MDVVGTGTLHADLRADELRMVENAVRLAIDSIINVLNGVNNARYAEYQRLVGDRDKTIQRLERRLEELEHELTAPPQPRHRRCPCGLTERTSGPSGLDEEEMAEVPQQCDWIPPLILSTTSSYLHKSSETSLSSESSSSVSMAFRNMPPSPSGPIVKEEQCEMATILIQTQMVEEDERMEGSIASFQEGHPLGKKIKLENPERTTQPEQHPTVPDRQSNIVEEQMRIKKRSVRMSQLTEEAQRLKRAAWRAASRRYYARKIARKQAKPQNLGPLHHNSHNQHLQLVPPVDRGGRTLISGRVLDSQTLQRDASRAAFRRK